MQNMYLKRIDSRDECAEYKGHYWKDLRRVIINFEKVVMLTIAISFVLQLNNGVWISSFDGNKWIESLKK